MPPHHELKMNHVMQLGSVPKFTEISAIDVSNKSLPTTFLYNKDEIFPARNQGTCGSCWAFATVSSIEDRLNLVLKKKGKKTGGRLSPEEIISCVDECTPGPNMVCGAGCDGGWPDLALDFLLKHRLVSENKWPYHASAEFCPRNLKSALADGPKSIKGWKHVGSTEVIPQPGSRELFQVIEAFKRDILQFGPMIGQMRVFSSLINNYHDGNNIYVRPRDATGRFTELGQGQGHAVVFIGWSHPNAHSMPANHPDYFKGAYWTIKNSWGTFWPYGEPPETPDGCFRIEMGNNSCNHETIGWSPQVSDKADMYINTIREGPKKFNNLPKTNQDDTLPYDTTPESPVDPVLPPPETEEQKEKEQKETKKTWVIVALAAIILMLGIAFL